CLAQTVNVLGAIRTTQTQVLKTPLYWAFWLYGRNTGKWRVACEVETPRGTMPTGGETPLVDASATLSEDGRMLFVGLINRHPESEVQVRLNISDFPAKPVVKMERLWSDHFTDTNTFEQPERVKPIEQTLPLTEALNLKLPRHSITLLKIERHD
ncbi:MAG: hypothetical protein NZL85_01450, partial [Fimbriimonadales bacterium]|nr:hypothetical protein [Fimbriimonadales bacterium]